MLGSGMLARIPSMDSATRKPPADPEDDLILPLCSIFRRYLKRQSLKFTPERAKILDAVMEKEGVFEADELADELRQRGHRVSKATIYRTLKHLKDAGIITEVLIDSKQAHYEQSFGKKTKGHLVCAETNQIIEFDAAFLAAQMHADKTPDHQQREQISQFQTAE